MQVTCLFFFLQKYLKKKPKNNKIEKKQTKKKPLNQMVQNFSIKHTCRSGQLTIGLNQYIWDYYIRGEVMLKYFLC